MDSALQTEASEINDWQRDDRPRKGEEERVDWTSRTWEIKQSGCIDNNDDESLLVSFIIFLIKMRDLLTNAMSTSEEDRPLPVLPHSVFIIE